MRIVFLAWRDTAHLQAGGSEVVIDQLASRLTKRGHDVVLLHGGLSGAHNYESIRVGGDYTQYPLAPIAFYRHCRNSDVVIDVENGIPFFSTMWQRRPVVGLVHHIHTEQWAMQFPRPVAAVGRWLEGSLMPRSYRRAPFVSVSPSTTEGLVGLGFPPDHISTIEMGLDFEPIDPAPSEEPRFLVLSRLVPHKRVDLALRIWDDVRPTTGGTLVVVGDGPELERLRSMSGPGVEFLGWVDENRKREGLISGIHIGIWVPSSTSKTATGSPSICGLGSSRPSTFPCGLENERFQRCSSQLHFSGLSASPMHSGSAHQSHGLQRGQLLHSLR